MAKQSALDAKVAEIDAILSAMATEAERLRGMRAFLTSADSPFVGTAAPKKRGRGKGKKGLPSAPAPEDENNRMAV